MILDKKVIKDICALLVVALNLITLSLYAPLEYLEENAINNQLGKLSEISHVDEDSEWSKSPTMISTLSLFTALVDVLSILSIFKPFLDRHLY